MVDAPDRAPTTAHHAASDWLPRREQEAKLRAFDQQLLVAADPTIMVERAALLVAMGRRTEAYQAFLDILRQQPTHFDALNEFGNLLTSNGSIDAACRVYAEAIANHPGIPTGYVNLGNLLRRQQRFDEALVHFERALDVDPACQPALQGIGAVHSDLGNFAVAQAYLRRGFRGCAITTLPYRGITRPLALLLLVASGGGNIPMECILDDRKYLTTVVVVDHIDPDAELPAHSLIFNAVGDADFCQPALQAAIALVARTTSPVINHPRSVLKTDRVGNALRLRSMPGVRTPLIASMSRASLQAAESAAMLKREGFTFPLLVRSPGFHTGKHFSLIDSHADLASALADMPGDSLLVIEFLNARGLDGSARKYRVMFVDGVLYPLHLAISRHWKVHYFTADMAEQDEFRREEAAFLSDMEAVLGSRALAALARIAGDLGLDYGGIDFAIGPDGEVLLFEANATMVVLEPPADKRWDYRRAAVGRILGAVATMIAGRAGVEHAPIAQAGIR